MWLLGLLKHFTSFFLPFLLATLNFEKPAKRFSFSIRFFMVNFGYLWHQAFITSKEHLLL